MKKLKYKPMHCPVCGNRFMNFAGQPLPNHSQIRCQTANGHDLDIAICNECINKGVSLETVNSVLAGIQDYWIADIDATDGLSAKEKKERKVFHTSLKIAKIGKIERTGKEASKKAKKRGDLKDYEETD